ncbi:hypothetical protein [Acetobacterium woodii]|uniref:Uncharacterized protein n=1 Tax=Acetobacterium woodii (strain ATCC 29683 / DSM 1030 / JCM 2381 / KCTC 1655 / WB1) TaxID=931626 RepID=H6LCD6_ACEWD|nr:hypothetical protein [Acetobacterium woodii]AFA50251.1 hypothetical protein Awo_c35270 [Acetobacterium woodii DSM 1030]
MNMNEFIKDGFELEKKKELTKAIALCCLDINSIGDKRNREAGKLCVFFHLSGHIGTIEVYMFENGWDRNCENDMTIRLDNYSALSEFEDCLNFLEALLIDQIMKDEEGKELCVELDQAVGA